MKKKNVKQNTVKEYWIHVIDRYFNQSKSYTNPVIHTCPARFAFDALEELGLGQWHNINDIIVHTQKLMSSVYDNNGFSKWDEFYTSPQSKGDPEARLRKIVLSLKYRYVARLEKMGCSIVDICKGDDIYLRLNTGDLKQNISAPAAPRVKPSIFRRMVSLFSAFIGMFHG
jgi:hypothetical protein